MLSELKPLAVVGMSNSEMFFPEKDLNSIEFNFLVGPVLHSEDVCDVVPLQDGHVDELPQKKEEVQQQEQGEEKEEKCKFLVSNNLEIKLPSPGKLDVEDDNDGDEAKTPTSLDHKIPVILRCPPAPRKPTSLPSAKRKSACLRARLDLSNEIEALFPPSLVADLGNKIKKVRQVNDLKLE